MNLLFIETNKSVMRGTMFPQDFYSPGLAVASESKSLKRACRWCTDITGISAHGTKMCSIYDLHFRISQQCQK